MSDNPGAAAPAARSTNASLFFVVLVVMIDMVGFGIVMPVFPTLITAITGDSISQAAVDAGWLALVYSVMQFVFGPIMGNLSDRFGRRPILLGTLLGFAISYTLMGLAPSLAWLFAGRIITGVMGASFSAANAYIADVSSPEKRAQNFGLIGMAFGFGFIIGPALGGLLGEIGPRIPFFAAGGLALANFIFGYFFLRESISDANRRPFRLLRANAFSALKGLGHQNQVVLWYAAALAIWALCHMVYPIIFAFYAIEAFGWSAFTIGSALALVGVTSAVVQGGMIRLVIPRIGERMAVILGVMGLAGGCIIYLTAQAGWLVFVAIVIGSIQGLVQPSITGLMSRAVGDDRQGELQGANASLASLASMVSPPLYTAIFFYFTQPGAPLHLPGAPFAMAALIALLALAIFLRGYALHAPRQSADDPASQL